MRRVLAILAVLMLAGACASSPPPPPKVPPDPDLAALTQWLKLDPEQQKKTRELLEQLAQRNALIREKWERQHRVRQEEWLASRSIFLHDLAAILTEEQQRLWAQANLKMQVKGRGRSSN
jgi:uncharacterized membrane-anchored protein YjiN (DUF445 family)